MTRWLDLGTLDLDAEAFATKTTGILAQRRIGKTYTASVIAEEMVKAKIPFAAIDPTGAWWGLRASADGKTAGLPVIVLGGAHGDVPLERTAGKVVADLVVDHPGYYVLDLSAFESKEADRQFATDFAERLYRRKSKADFPMHLFVDEADIFVPQRVPSGDQRMLGAFEAIVRRGGIRGLGTTLISQRAAVVNKNVLEQIDILIALRIVGPNDRKAIKDYLVARGSAEMVADVMEHIASLDIGQAVFWEPGEDMLQYVKVRERRTFNSSATPGSKARKVEPKVLADVDLAALTERMAATIEKAKAEDPRELRREIDRLRRALSAAEQQAHTEVKEVEKRVEVPVLTDHERKALDGIAEQLANINDVVKKRIETGATAIVQEPKVQIDKSRVKKTAPEYRDSVGQRYMDHAGLRNDDVKLGKGERNVLAVLRSYPRGRTHNELAFLAGYSAKASTLGVILSNLRKQGLVEPGQPIRLTGLGAEAAGGFESPLTGEALWEQWIRHPRMGGGERRVLTALRDHYPDDVSHEELCEETGYSTGASTMGVILSNLRKLGLVEKGRRRLAPEFAETIR